MVRKQDVSKENPISTEPKSAPVGGSLRTHYLAWKSLTDNWWALGAEPHTSLTLPCSSTATNGSRKEEGARPGGIENSTEEGNWNNLKCGILQLAFRISEGGGWQPVINLKRLNVYLDIKPGGDLYPQRCVAVVRLDGELLSNGLYPPQRQEVPEILLQQQVLPIQKPSIWASYGTSNLHIAHEAYGYSHAEQVWDW